MNDAIRPVTIVTTAPPISLIAQQQLEEAGILEMAEWVKAHRPDCVPATGFKSMWDLLPHGPHDLPHDVEARAPWHRDDYLEPGGTRPLTGNEVLAEIAGRKCYDSFADAAGRKTNKDYFEHIVSMDPMHASIMYHPKMTFLFRGVSRKFSHQFIRNYVGSDRDEEGSPSQESTRFTHHYGWYIAPPYIVDQPLLLSRFATSCQNNYNEYNAFIVDAVDTYRAKHGKAPTGGDKKDIFEAAAGYLTMSAETSFVWTTNPMALRKFLKERCHGAADAEIFRFAQVLARLCFRTWPNLFLGADLDGVRKEVS